MYMISFQSYIALNSRVRLPVEDLCDQSRVSNPALECSIMLSSWKGQHSRLRIPRDSAKRVRPSFTLIRVLLVLHGFIITWPIGYYEIPLDEISEQSPLYIATAMQITGAATPILLASPALESYSIMLVLLQRNIIHGPYTDAWWAKQNTPSMAPSDPSIIPLRSSLSETTA